MKHFKDTWSYDMPTSEVRELVISSTVEEPDDDGEGNTHHRDKSYTLSMPGVVVPQVLVKYGDTMRVTVEPDDATFLACVEVEMFNDRRYEAEREYRRKLDDVLDRFSTLNQLMKAAPYIKDLVPQERLQKMHEKDDRSERRKEQAELADNELSGLREVLLEDALLGDDS